MLFSPFTSFSVFSPHPSLFSNPPLCFFECKRECKLPYHLCGEIFQGRKTGFWFSILFWSSLWATSCFFVRLSFFQFCVQVFCERPSEAQKLYKFENIIFNFWMYVIVKVIKTGNSTTSRIRLTEIKLFVYLWEIKLFVYVWEMLK